VNRWRQSDDVTMTLTIDGLTIGYRSLAYSDRQNPVIGAP
jgi:hypothetical protein